MVRISTCPKNAASTVFCHRGERPLVTAPTEGCRPAITSVSKWVVIWDVSERHDLTQNPEYGPCGCPSTDFFAPQFPVESPGRACAVGVVLQNTRGHARSSAIG